MAGGAGSPAKYLRRLLDTQHRDGWRAAWREVGALLRWRLSSTARAARGHRRENAAFDLLHGTDTQGEIPLQQLGIDDRRAARGNGIYRAIPTSHFQAALSLLHVDFTPYTFVDYGSGKGKALLLAAAHPFRRIVGVEFSTVLHEVARRNLARYRGPERCREIELLNLDAQGWDPPAGPLVCFFFNPFDAATWRAVLARLHRSHAASPRPMHLVYVNVRDVGELPDLFREFTLFVPVATERTVRIFSAVPRAPLADARGSSRRGSTAPRLHPETAGAAARP